MEILFFLPFLFIFLISVPLFIFWIWMLIDCLQRKFEDTNQQLIWVLVIVLTNWIGALIYFFVERAKPQAQPAPLMPPPPLPTDKSTSQGD